MHDSDSDDDYVGLQRQALPVDLPPDFNPAVIPQNGEEYLHCVMYEARNCEQSTYAKIDSKKIKDRSLPSTMLFPQDNFVTALPNSNFPSEDWQQCKLVDFNKLRKFIEKKRESLINMNSCTSTKISFDDSPTYSDLISSSQPRILYILQTLLNSVENLNSINKAKYNECMWLYGLLACLEIPLCPNTCYLLREFARSYKHTRSELKENCVDPELTYYNLIICIIGRYFNQKDLADI